MMDSGKTAAPEVARDSRFPAHRRELAGVTEACAACAPWSLSEGGNPEAHDSDRLDPALEGACRPFGGHHRPGAWMTAPIRILASGAPAANVAAV